MSDVNIFTFSGRLTRDAESKSVGQKNSLLTTFTVANNTGFGQYAKSQFFDVQEWGQKGQAIQPYLIKGKNVVVTGTLENSSWTGSDGVKHDKWIVTASDVCLLSDGKGRNEDKSEFERSNTVW